MLWYLLKGSILSIAVTGLVALPGIHDHSYGLVVRVSVVALRTRSTWNMWPDLRIAGIPTAQLLYIYIRTGCFNRFSLLIISGVHQFSNFTNYKWVSKFQFALCCISQWFLFMGAAHLGTLFSSSDEFKFKLNTSSFGLGFWSLTFKTEIFLHLPISFSISNFLQFDAWCFCVVTLYIVPLQCTWTHAHQTDV